MSLDDIPPSQLLALHEHSKPIDEFEAARRDEESRFESRRKEIDARIYALAKQGRIPSDEACNRSARIGSRRCRESRMRRFDREHRPHVEPFDTPLRIIEAIECEWERWRRIGQLWQDRDYSPMAGLTYPRRRCHKL
jgi:hypothetical protein